jgi:hypothetical protein
MKTALLLYPYDSVLKLLKVILERKGFAILSLDADKGLIKAESKFGLFKKSSKLDIAASKRDQHTTHIEIRINANPSTYDSPRTSDEDLEDELIDVIYKYF